MDTFIKCHYVNHFIYILYFNCFILYLFQILLLILVQHQYLFILDTLQLLQKIYHNTQGNIFFNQIFFENKISNLFYHIQIYMKIYDIIFILSLFFLFLLLLPYYYYQLFKQALYLLFMIFNQMYSFYLKFNKKQIYIKIFYFLPLNNKKFIFNYIFNNKFSIF